MAAAVRNARTMTTGAECAGRVDSYKRAEDMGIQLQQEWMSTLDGRTRHSHRELHGERIEVDGTFSNGCRFPGDPHGPAEEVYNCRCTLVAAIKGFESDKVTYSPKLGEQSFEEWVGSKENTKVAESVPVVEPKYIFVEAKTIEEAQEYAKQFCQSDFMAKNFKNGVEYKGISVENANKINQALTDVFNNVELDKISGIKTVAPNSALGKKAFKDGADAVFSYDPIQHGIYVNKDVLKNEKTFADYVKRSDESWNTVMNNIDKLSGSQKELALVYKNAGRSLVDGNTVEGLFTHELGHHAQWTLLDAKTNNAVGSRMYEFAPKISGYANASKSEYLAESFAAYMKGERSILDPEYVKFIDSKAIDISLKVEYNMYRKTHNTGAFSKLSEPMQQRYVEKLIEDMGIDISGIEIDILHEEKYIGKGLFGYTMPNGKRIQLYPDAFANREELVKTIGHERIHCEQIRLFGKAKNDDELHIYERAARFSEDYWWEIYKERTGYV